MDWEVSPKITNFMVNTFGKKSMGLLLKRSRFLAPTLENGMKKLESGAK
jgi:hypothetical protein